MAYPLGRRLHQLIESRQFPGCSIHGSFFRARLVRTSDVLDSEALAAPIRGVSPGHRFSHAGQRVFYAAETKDVAVAEVIGEMKAALVWTQEFKITPLEPLLDLTLDIESALDQRHLLIAALLDMNALARPSEDGSTWKPAYLMTQFIADCARKAAYVGIKYSSTRGPGENIVIFDPDALAAHLCSEGEPSILVHKPRADKF